MKKDGKDISNKKASPQGDISIAKSAKALTKRDVALSGRRVSVTIRKTALLKTDKQKADDSPII